ncbi:MAG: putative quinol monooxygenase [Shimia sp.]|uniref:putative quinol monooxygenase n=1 Tax=Shimia sp. TaxID=1954381 RepID=UPI00405857A6
MFVVCVTFTIKPAMMDAFMPLMLEQAQNSLSLEPACLRFDVCSKGTSEDEVFLYEIYADEAAFMTHLGSAHFKSFDAAAADLLASKAVTTYGQVALGV